MLYLSGALSKLLGTLKLAEGGIVGQAPAKGKPPHCSVRQNAGDASARSTLGP